MTKAFDVNTARKELEDLQKKAAALTARIITENMGNDPCDERHVFVQPKPAALDDDVCDEFNRPLYDILTGVWGICFNSEDYIKFYLRSAENRLLEVKEKCAINQRGYDDVMLRAHENRVQGLKNTLNRLEIKE